MTVKLPAWVVTRALKRCPFWAGVTLKFSRLLREAPERANPGA